MIYQLEFILLKATGTTVQTSQMIKKMLGLKQASLYLEIQDSEQSACIFYSLYQMRWALKQSVWTHTSRVARP